MLSLVLASQVISSQVSKFVEFLFFKSNSNTLRLDRTKKLYTFLWKKKILNISIGTGFCGETEDEFVDTLSVMRQVKYHVAFMFAYSMREVSKPLTRN